MKKFLIAPALLLAFALAVEAGGHQTAAPAVYAAPVARQRTRVVVRAPRVQIFRQRAPVYNTYNSYNVQAAPVVYSAPAVTYRSDVYRERVTTYAAPAPLPPRAPAYCAPRAPRAPDYDECPPPQASFAPPAYSYAPGCGNGNGGGVPAEAPRGRYYR